MQPLLRLAEKEMPTTFFRAATWSLLIVVIVVLGMTTAGAVAHDLKHAAHHTASMHTSGICAWMCAAGQMLEGIQVVLQTDSAPILFAALPVFHKPCNNIPLVSASRGPPVFSI